jgi:hypothetical protein
MRSRSSVLEVRADPRRVVVEAERDGRGIGDVEAELHDVGIGRADIGRGRDDRAVRALRRRLFDIGDGGVGRRAGAAVIEMHLACAHLHGLAHDGVALFRAQHGDLAGGSHEQDGRRAVFRVKLYQRAEAFEVDGAVLVHRRDKGDEGAFNQCAGHGRLS